MGGISEGGSDDISEGGSFTDKHPRKNRELYYSSLEKSLLSAANEVLKDESLRFKEDRGLQNELKHVAALVTLARTDRFSDLSADVKGEFGSVGQELSRNLTAIARRNDVSRLDFNDNTARQLSTSIITSMVREAKKYMGDQKDVAR